MSKRNSNLKRRNNELKKEIKRLNELVDAVHFLHKGIVSEIKK